MPRLFDQLTLIDAAIGEPRERTVLESVWECVDDQAIDTGIMERAEGVAVVPVDIGWSDIGSWSALADILPSDSEGNVVAGCEHVGLETTGSLLYGTGRRLVATVGLEDMIIVETEDVVFVCPKDRAQEVKELVARLEAGDRTEYL
jgi:mannose-1-phosphate guanylyltransferase